jgi:uncharacterized protein YhbP (UPF0306 family)
MIRETHWTEEGYKRFIDSQKMALEILARRKSHLEQKNINSNSAEYCETAKVVAIIEGETCTGEIREKGSGIKEKDDKYGVSYSRRCALVGVCKKVKK